MSFEVVLSTTPSLAEGALWSSRRRELLWVDILGCAVHRFDPVTGKNHTHQLPSYVGTVVPRADGALHLALREGFARFDPVTENLSAIVTAPGHDSLLTRFNDGKCDPHGRFLAGSISLQGTPNAAALYVLEAGHVPRRLLEGVSISNGLCWDAGGSTLYYIDTPTRRIDAFDYDLATATLQNRRTVVELAADLGYPDGMTIDCEGLLWVALWGGGAVVRCDPRRGTIVAKYPLPVSLVTSCAFGGEKLDTLYVTSARCELTAAEAAGQPLAGSLLALSPGVRGCPAFEFKG